MYLQLAEKEYIPPSVYMAQGQRSAFTYVKRYRRKGSVVPGHYRALSEEESDNPYVVLPAHVSPTGATLAVREDYFDDLDDNEWRGLMFQLLPYQPQVKQGMSEGMFLAAKADRKKRREDRKKQKEEKKKLKLDKKAAKNEIKKARAQAKREGRGADILGSVIDGISNIFGKGGEEETATTTTDTTQAGFTMPKVLGMPIWIPAAAIAGGIFLATRGRRRRRR